jgi:CDP-diacylglycerol--glycerol-3-phosphate 3-phosphatidyltransferase
MNHSEVTKINFFDKILQIAILWAIPKWVTPNAITIFRFICIPFVIYFLIIQDYAILIPLFTVAVLSDAIDGAIARTRNQVTDLGKVIDPIADKILISVAAIVLVTRHIGIFYTLLIVLIEIVILFGAIYQNKKYGQKIEAQSVGKLKMVFQSLGIGFLILYSALSSYVLLLSLGQIFIALSILFAFLSLFVYKSI